MCHWYVIPISIAVLTRLSPVSRIFTKADRQGIYFILANAIHAMRTLKCITWYCKLLWDLFKSSCILTTRVMSQNQTVISMLEELNNIKILDMNGMFRLTQCSRLQLHFTPTSGQNEYNIHLTRQKINFNTFGPYHKVLSIYAFNISISHGTNINQIYQVI